MAISAEQKRAIAERARFCCEYCQSQLRYSSDAFSVEHILPISRGGSDDLDNLALSCQGCNNCKFTALDAIDPVTGLTAVLYNPRQHLWNQHFVWSTDCVTLIGLTPIGRATIARLKLNRDGVVNLRRILHAVGEFPPTA